MKRYSGCYTLRETDYLISRLFSVHFDVMFNKYGLEKTYKDFLYDYSEKLESVSNNVGHFYILKSHVEKLKVLNENINC